MFKYANKFVSVLMIIMMLLSTGFYQMPVVTAASLAASKAESSAPPTEVIGELPPPVVTIRNANGILQELPTAEPTAVPTEIVTEPPTATLETTATSEPTATPEPTPTEIVPELPTVTPEPTPTPAPEEPVTPTTVTFIKPIKPKTPTSEPLPGVTETVVPPQLTKIAQPTPEDQTKPVDPANQILKIIIPVAPADVVATISWADELQEHPSLWLQLWQVVDGETNLIEGADILEVKSGTIEATWPALPTTTSDGKAITYTVLVTDEKGNPQDPAGYTSAVDGLTVTMSAIVLMVPRAAIAPLVAEVIWPEDTLEKPDVLLELYVRSKDTDAKKVENVELAKVDKATNQAKWDKQPLEDRNGKKLDYSVKVVNEKGLVEDPAGFTSSVSGLMVTMAAIVPMAVGDCTGSYAPDPDYIITEPTDYSTNGHSALRKMWVQGGTYYIAVASTHEMGAATVNGVPGTKIETCSAGGSITIGSWTSAPVDLQGDVKDSHWTVYSFPLAAIHLTGSGDFVFVEGNGNGHELSGTFTVSIRPVDLTMTKTWLSGTPTSSVIVFLYQRVATLYSSTGYTLDPTNSWAKTISVPKHAPDGFLYSYSLIENPVPLGFDATYAGAGSYNLTVTNTYNPPSLTLVKALDIQYGGLASITDWDLTATGVTTLSGKSGKTGQVMPGIYTLSESTGPAGYEMVGWVCVLTGTTTPVTVTTNQVTLRNGQNVTCTVTNTDKPTGLTLTKIVSKNWGGTKFATDWTLSATCNLPTSCGTTSFSGAGGASSSVPAGTYTLSETPVVAGYTAGKWVCNGTELAGSNVLVSYGQAVTCTITNNDQSAKLTLVKEVTNNNGGTAGAGAWTLTATGSTTITGISGTAAVTSAPVSAGTYTLSESGPGGYTPSNWVCVGGSYTSGTQALVLGNGESATCTINNDDQAASLTLVKTVTNDNGGTALDTDWTLSAVSGSTTVLSGAGGATGSVAAGTYTLSESTGPSGYTAGTWSCTAGTLTGSSLVLGIGVSATCTINNDDQAATLTLVKTMTNDNGGTAVPTAWTLTAVSGSTTVLSGAGGATGSVAAGTYTLSESTGPGGYTAGAWSCTAGTLTGSSLVLGSGVSATCTINNDDQAASLTLVKTVTNDNGGTALDTDWTLSAAGPTTISGATGSLAVTNKSVSAGTYILSETGPGGYTASDWVCVGGSYTSGTQALVLNNGDSATCTINNDDQAASLTLVKTVTNDNGGTGLDTAWTLTAAGPTPNISGATGSPAVTGAPVSAGTYTLSEIGPGGYTASDWVCVGGSYTSGTQALVLNNGDSATCTINNDDQAATLTLVKTMTNDNGGTALVIDWTLSAAGPTPISGATGSLAVTNKSVSAGTYILSETGPSGYTAGTWSCTAGTLTGSSLVLGIGVSATCTINNDDQAATLTLVKTMTNDNGGTAVPTAWTLTAAGPTPNISGATGSPAVTSAPVSAGTYTLSETGPGGYTAGAWSCTAGTLIGSSLVLGSGVSATCTINNDDQAATLTLVKVVIDGASAITDWTLSAAGPTPISGATGSPAVTGAPVSAGTYTLSESGPANYAASTWTCALTENQIPIALASTTLTEVEVIDNKVTLLNGQAVICTITNTYVPPMDAAFAAIKVWDGGYSTDHIAVPLTLWRQIANGPIEQVSGATPGITPDPGTTPTSDIYNYSWTGLAATDALGNAYTYYATEEIYKYYQRQYSASITIENVEYCTAVESACIIANIAPNRSSSTLLGIKVWKDGPTTKPAVWLQLMQSENGGTAQPYLTPVMLDGLADAGCTSGCEKLAWQAIWLNVPTNDNMGKSWTYFVKEVDASGANWQPANYTKSESQMTVTNTYVPPTLIDPPVASKKWANFSGPYPTVWMLLYRQVAGGVPQAVGSPVPLDGVVGGDCATGCEVVAWSARWDGLSATDLQGNVYTYFVKETNANGQDWTPDHFTKTYSGMTVTNTYVSQPTPTPIIVIPKTGGSGGDMTGYGVFTLIALMAFAGTQIMAVRKKKS
jgi:hypothetical protein